MADRKVSVRLTAEVRDFRTAMKESVDAVQKLARSGEITDEALAQMQRQADKAAVSLLKLAADGRLSAAELGKADRQVDQLRDSLVELGAASHLGGGAGAMAAVQAEVVKTKARVKELGDEFRRTGSASSFSGLKDAQRDLLKLENLAKDMGRELGHGAAPATVKELSAGLSNPQVWALAIPAVAAAAVPLGQAVGGAVLLGIGLAGVGAGIAGQIHDPLVVAAGTRLGHDVATGFKSATSEFQAPLLGAINVFDAEWKRLQPGLKSTFTQLAPLVTDLGKGAAGFVDALVPGLERAAVAAKPLVQDFAAWLPRFGSVLGSLFDTMAAHEKDAEKGLHLIEGGLTAVVVIARDAIPVLSAIGDALDFAKKFGPLGPLIGIYNSFHDLSTGGELLGKSLVGVDSSATAAGQSLDALQQKLTATATTMSTVAGAATAAVFNALMSIDRANLSVAQSLTQVTQAIKANGKHLDLLTSKGQANRSAVLDAVSANMQLYTAQINSGVSAQDAAAAYDSNTAALERTLRKAGVAQSEIDGLIGKYRKIPSKVNTLLAIQGLTDAINGLADLIRRINGLHDKTVTITTRYTKIGAGPFANKPIPNEYGGIRHFASGGALPVGSAGIVSGGGPYAMFGEPGTGANTEGFLPERGISRMAAGGLLDTMAGWYGYGVVDHGRRAGGGVVAVTATLQVTGDGDSALFGAIQKAVRSGAIQFFVAGQPVSVRSGR